MIRPIACLLLLLVSSVGPAAAAADTIGGRVFSDNDGDGMFDAGESGIADVAVSNGRIVTRTDVGGAYRLPVQRGQTVFIVKPAGWRAASGGDRLPMFWRQQPLARPSALKYGGLPHGAAATRFDFPLQREPRREGDLDVLVFGDPQPKSMTDVGYYDRDIVTPLLGRHAARLGISLGDIVHDDLSLYPAINASTAKLGIPWLHAAGNHDLDFDAARDEDSLSTFRRHFGPDSFAWEEARAVFVVLDDVVYQPGDKPAYVGGFRDDQFAFLEAYLPTVPKDRLLVLAMHIPLFEATPGRDTFRDADRARLFALLQDFPHVLVLSAHSHTQRHWFHDAGSGWHGASPLHEYNVGAACGAFWSGVKDAAGIPDSTMADGTPNGYATLRVAAEGKYALAWHPARDARDTRIGLHAPKVLRRGAWPGWAVYANVYMGRDDTRVEYRIDDGDWMPMSHVAQPDPRLVIENMNDDLADTLRGYDRSPEAEPSPHLWRGALPTDGAIGEHRIEVRAFDAWQGELRAQTQYRLDTAEHADGH